MFALQNNGGAKGGVIGSMLGKILAEVVAKKIRTRKSWVAEKPGNTSSRSCNKLYFTENERVNLTDEQTNEVANIQLVLLEYYGDPRMLYKQAHFISD